VRLSSSLVYPLAFPASLTTTTPALFSGVSNALAQNRCLCILCNLLGYHADIANNGLEILDSLRRQNNDVVLDRGCANTENGRFDDNASDFSRVWSTNYVRGLLR